MSESNTLCEVRFVGDLQRLQLQPGDKLVLSVDAVLPGYVRERLKEQVEQFFGDGIRCLVLERGMELGAVSGLASIIGQPLKLTAHEWARMPVLQPESGPSEIGFSAGGVNCDPRFGEPVMTREEWLRAGRTVTD